MGIKRNTNLLRFSHLQWPPFKIVFKKNSQNINLLDLPTKFLQNVIQHLDFEDVRALRASCRTFSNLCVDFMKDQTIFINDCSFPKSLLDWNFECIQRNVQFGKNVTCDLKNSSTFLKNFCKNFTSLSFERCFSIGNEDILELLDYFPNLRELRLKDYKFLSLMDNFEINEKLDGTLRNLRSITIDKSLLLEPIMIELFGRMTNVADIEIDLDFLFLSRISKNFSYLVQNHTSKLKYLTIDHCSTIETLNLIHQIPDAQLQLKGIKCTMSRRNRESLKALCKKQQEHLEGLQIVSLCFEESIGGILSMLPHLKSLNMRFDRSFLGLSFMRDLNQLESLVIEFGAGVHKVQESLSCNPDFHIAYGLENVYLKLRSFSISNTNGTLCAKCWEKIILSFPNLRTLSVSNVSLGVESCQYMFTKLQLKKLALNSCNITNEHLFGTPTSTAGFEKQGSLSQLSLRFNPSITTIPALPNLRQLDASHTGIRSIENLSRNFPILTCLSVAGCSALEFSETSKLGSSVSILNISWCQKNQLRITPKMFPRLRKLITTNCELTEEEEKYETRPRFICFREGVKAGEKRLDRCERRGVKKKKLKKYKQNQSRKWCTLL